MAKLLVVVAGPDQGCSFPLTEGAPLLVGRGKDVTARINLRGRSRVSCFLA